MSEFQQKQSGLWAPDNLPPAQFCPGCPIRGTFLGLVSADQAISTVILPQSANETAEVALGFADGEGGHTRLAGAEYSLSASDTPVSTVTKIEEGVVTNEKESEQLLAEYTRKLSAIVVRRVALCPSPVAREQTDDSSLQKLICPAMNGEVFHALLSTIALEQVG